MSDLTYEDMARLQQATLGETPLTPELARHLAAYWVREIGRLKEQPLIAGRLEVDPVWPQEYKRAETLAATLATAQVTEFTPAQKLQIWDALKRFATEMTRWQTSDTMKQHSPAYQPLSFRWPGKAIIAGGTEVQGAGGGGLMLLLLAWLFLGKGGGRRR